MKAIVFSVTNCWLPSNRGCVWVWVSVFVADQNFAIVSVAEEEIRKLALSLDAFLFLSYLLRWGIDRIDSVPLLYGACTACACAPWSIDDLVKAVPSRHHQACKVSGNTSHCVIKASVSWRLHLFVFTSTAALPSIFDHSAYLSPCPNATFY